MNIHPELRTTNLSRVVALLMTLLILAGEGRSQCQVQKVTPPDIERSDFFGQTVAIDGDWAIVGMPEDDDIVDQSGAVYVFQRIGSSWTQTQKLKPNDASFGCYMGSSVAIAGDVLVAGAHNDTPLGLPPAAGSAYVFERTQSGWSQVQKLVAGDPGYNERFGWSVALQGTRLLVGAKQDDHAGIDSGAAYVFDRVGTVWTQTVKLTANDATPFDAFGTSVSLSGDRALIGAGCKDGPGGTCQGAAYIFENQMAGWVQVKKLLASDGIQNNAFGFAVALSSMNAIVGAPNHSHPLLAAGAVYVFTNTGTDWVESQELGAIDAGSSNKLGGNLCLSGDHFVSGAPGDNDNGGASGSAYVFRLLGSTWIQTGKLLAHDGSQSDIFGISVGFSADTAILGAWGDDDACPGDIGCNSGSAYLFQLAPSATQYGDCATGSPCNNPDNHGGCRNSTGQGAILAACGSGSVATDDLQLELTHCPPNKLTLLFMGPGQTQVPFADGLRVVAPQSGVGVYRLGGVNSDAQGMVIRGPGLVAQTQSLPAPGRIQSGQTWNFQFWYRDPPGPCGGHTNFSNGAQVAFTP